jgi:hypothetical protein
MIGRLAHLLGKFVLDVQRAVADVGSAEVAAGVTQDCACLLAVALELGGVQLGAQRLEECDGLVDIALGVQKILDRCKAAN